MKLSFTLIALPLACISQATLVDFSASAQVSSIDDRSHHFGTVNLGDTFSVHVHFDTTQATKVSTTGVYPDAVYSIASPTYMSTHLDSNYLDSTGAYNVLYVTKTHPTVDFMDYQAQLAPNEYVEMYFEGPKGTLPSTSIPIGYPNFGWRASFIRYTWTDPHGSAFITATNTAATPEPASMAALGIGSVLLARRRKARR